MARGFWVNDCVGIGSGAQLEALVKSVDGNYGITRLGEVKWVLGMLMEHNHSARTILISQEALSISPFQSHGYYTSLDTTCPKTQEEKDEMANQPYKELVGVLLWLALGTRPNIAYTTSSLTCFGHNPHPLGGH